MALISLVECMWMTFSSVLSSNMADSYIRKDRRILKLKHGKKCIISLQSFLKLDGICKIEFWTLLS